MQPEDLYARPDSQQGFKAPLTRVVATPCYRCALRAVPCCAVLARVVGMPAVRPPDYMSTLPGLCWL